MCTKYNSSANKLNAEHAKVDAELCTVRTELILPATESETRSTETDTAHQTHQLSGKCQSWEQAGAAVRKCLGQQLL